MLTRYTISSPVGALTIKNWDTDNSITPQLTRGVYEPHVQAIIHTLVGSDFKCLDIGANIGIHSLLLSKIAKKTEVIECSSENVELINKNFDANKMPLPKVHCLALGDGQKIRFSRAEKNHACSFTATTNHSQSEEITSIVQTYKLHDVVDFQPDFIKIDIEGAELNTINSSPEIFKNAKYVCIELNKFTCESFFDIPISDLIDAMFKLHKICLVYTDKFYQVTREWLLTFFEKNLMIDVVFTNKTFKL